MKEVKKHIPMRRCVGCGISKEQNKLKRVYLKEELLRVDEERKVHGRGVYICPDDECLKKAFKKKAFERAFKRQISDEAKENLKKEVENE